MKGPRRQRRPVVHEPTDVELTLGGAASGGTCVAHSDDVGDRSVYFVRGGLPGERVRARTTGSSGGGRVRFAAVVEVLVSSPDRVVPPCPVAHQCGGCDFQHVAEPAQRQWKAQVLRDQLKRLGRIDLVGGEAVDAAVRVAEVPLGTSTSGAAGGGNWRGWRSRVTVEISDNGQVGFHAHRSSEVVPVGACPVVVDQLQPLFGALGQPGVRIHASAAETPTIWPESSDGEQSHPLTLPPGWRQRSWVNREALGRSFRVATDGFWQAHIEAPELLAKQVLELAALTPGESALDLYSGVGLFAAALATSTVPATPVVAVEGDTRAVRLARRNVHDLPSIRVVHSDVRQYAFDSPVDVTVLDPPRAGAGAEVIDAVAAVTSRAIVHVGCDGANTARDLGRLVAAGWRLQTLRAFDLFPMTQHLETVALLERSNPT